MYSIKVKLNLPFDLSSSLHFSRLRTYTIRTEIKIANLCTNSSTGLNNFLNN
jgi:hypothetical protein